MSGGGGGEAADPSLVAAVLLVSIFSFLAAVMIAQYNHPDGLLLELDVGNHPPSTTNRLLDQLARPKVGRQAGTCGQTDRRGAGRQAGREPSRQAGRQKQPALSPRRLPLAEPCLSVCVYMRV